jgi:hypothetical protein
VCVWSGLYLFGWGQGPIWSCCEHGDEHSDTINVGEFLTKLSDYQVLKDKSAACVQLVKTFPQFGVSTPAHLTALIAFQVHTKHSNG